MSPAAPDPDVLLRLQRLERTNRRLTLALGAVALLGGALALASFARPAQDAGELRARALVLVDAGGAELGRFAADAQGFPTLLLRKDKASAVLTLREPGLALRGSDGKKGAWLGIDAQGLVGLALNGDELRGGLRASVRPDGGSGFFALADDGRERASLEQLPDGDSAVAVRDRTSIPRAMLRTGADGVPGLLVLDDRGGRRAGIVVQADGTPLLSLDDARGRARLELSQRFDGHTRLRTLAEDGATSFEAP